MTTRVERTFDLDASPDQVWEFITDPENRAEPISVVESFEVHDETHATWHLSIPISVIDSTITVETEDTKRDPPSHVEFVGRSDVMRIIGEHDLEELEEGTRLKNRFTVEGQIPGVEQFFEANFDSELENLESAIRRKTEISPK
ncbi:CoxG family protein [Halococcus salsus]|uniref:CoxG family protein n=1 Tax=Halococcus salsus TaxID=2162894 RepID=UPI0013583355|nr:SRPBCC family protein [Halococcus salsus]